MLALATLLFAVLSVVHYLKFGAGWRFYVCAVSALITGAGAILS